MRFGLYLLRFRQSCYHCRFSNTILFYVKVDGVIQPVLLLVAEVSVSSSAALQMAQHTTPDYKNWISFAHGLINVFCNGLRPFVTREMESFYNKVSPGTGPCTCTFVPRRRPNQYHDMSTCTWANVLQGHHHRNAPNWKQSDSTKWTDPIQGPWEIGKLFLPDLPRGHVITSAEDMEVTMILNLMYWCDHFRPISQPLINNLRVIRNRKFGHVEKLKLTDAERATAFGAMEALLQNPGLALDLDAQNALHEIQILKTVTDVDNFQAQILMQCKEAIEKDISCLQTRVKTESRQNQKVRKQLEKRLHLVEKKLENLEDTTKTKDNFFTNQCKNGAMFFCSTLIMCTRVMTKRLLTPWLMIILLCNFSVTHLDPRSYQDGRQ